MLMKKSKFHLEVLIRSTDAAEEGRRLTRFGFGLKIILIKDSKIIFEK